MLPGIAQNPHPVFMSYFAQHILIVVMIKQGVEKFRHPRYITEFQRHDGAIKVGAESHVPNVDVPSYTVIYAFWGMNINLPSDV